MYSALIAALTAINLQPWFRCHTMFCLVLATVTLGLTLALTWLAVWHSGSALVSIKEVNLRRARLPLGWVIVSGIQLPVQENVSQYIAGHPGQLSLAIPPWVGAMNTGQSTAMLCSWGVKAGMVCEWVAGKTM